MEELIANVIDEIMLSQIDSEVHHYQVPNNISDKYMDGSALKKSDGFIRGRGGNPHSNKTARGCKLEVKCKYGTLSCIPLKDIKASNPIELAEYVVAKNIEDEPAFKWWV